MKIAVIIPFYQREQGILLKALIGAFAQDLPIQTELWVIVVDDSSPVPATDEVAGLATQDRNRVTVLTQPNGGPGDARNRALDLVAARGADYVAFLDSDDVWKPTHLRDATNALEKGFDFYFCDHTRFDATTTHSSIIVSLTELSDHTRPGYQMIDARGPVISADNASVLSAYLKEYLSQTSTVVLRQSCVQQLRFDPELRGAGEDHLFWIMLVASGARMAISSRVNVYCGRGINIYFGSFDYGSVKTVNRIGYLFLFWDKCAKLKVADNDRADAAQMAQRYIRAYSYMFVRALFRGQRPDFRLFQTIRRRIPFMPVAMPFRFLSVLPRRREESKLW